MKKNAAGKLKCHFGTLRILKGKFLLALILSEGLFFPSYSSAQMNCKDLFFEDSISTTINLQNNNYMEFRILDSYNDFFKFPYARDLLQTLSSLRQGTTWFDMGSGKNVALVKGLERNPQIRRGVGVSATRTEFALGDKRVPGRLKQVNGDYLEKLVAAGRLKNQMGKVDLVTDVFGPLSYSQNVVEVMQIYLDLLSKNGQLMTAFLLARGTAQTVMESEKIHSYNAVMTESGLSKRGLLEWLKSIPGIAVEVVEQKIISEDGKFEHTTGVRITKLQDKVIVPKTIKVDKEVPTVPPLRIFVPVNAND